MKRLALVLAAVAVLIAGGVAAWYFSTGQRAFRERRDIHDCEEEVGYADPSRLADCLTYRHRWDREKARVTAYARAWCRLVQRDGRLMGEGRPECQ